jgi:hypothetical protein
LVSVCILAASVGLRARAITVYAQTGFNDQSGINSDGTVGSPYAIGQTINGRVTNEPGWAGAWTTLNGGALGGDSNAVVSSTNPYEGDGAVALTVGSFGSTEMYRYFATTRTDEFVVEQRVNFGSAGEFDGYVTQNDNPLSTNAGPQWRLIGAVGQRHFEVFNGNSLGGGTWLNTGIAQTPGQYQDVVLDVNVVTQQWSFAVDGVHYTGSSLGFISQPAQLSALYYFDSAAGSVDSIIVRSTPEPGASVAAIAAIGALSLARRRRIARA